MDDARAQALPPAALGMLTRLVWIFWAGDCAPLPDATDRLFVLAHAQRATWKAHSATILAILADACPELHKRRERARAQSAHLATLSQRGASSTALKALRKSAPLVDVAAPIAPTARQAKPAPAPTPRDGEGFVDRIRR